VGNRSTAPEERTVEFTLPGVQAEDVVAALKEAAADLSGDTGSGYVRSLGPVRVLRSPVGDVCHVAIPVTLGDPWTVEENGQRWQASASYKGRLVFSLVADAGDSVCVESRAEGEDGCDLRSGILKALASRFRDPAVQRALLYARAEALGCRQSTAEAEAAPGAGDGSMDGAVESSPPNGAPAKPHGTQGGTIDRVREARELFEGGMSKTEACKRAHVDTRTYDRHIGYVIDLSQDDD
jgi:hypothetical protein